MNEIFVNASACDYTWDGEGRRPSDDFAKWLSRRYPEAEITFTDSDAHLTEFEPGGQDDWEAFCDGRDPYCTHASAYEA